MFSACCPSLIRQNEQKVTSDPFPTINANDIKVEKGHQLKPGSWLFRIIDHYHVTIGAIERRWVLLSLRDMAEHSDFTSMSAI